MDCFKCLGWLLTCKGNKVKVVLSLGKAFAGPSFQEQKNSFKTTNL